MGTPTFWGVNLRVAERNRAIKKALSKVFGRENVRVRGDRGTAYGWVDITITQPKNHKCDGNWRCQECIKQIEEIKRRVWDILKETGLINYLYTYYNDMNERRYECIVEVKLT